MTIQDPRQDHYLICLIFLVVVLDSRYLKNLKIKLSLSPNEEWLYTSFKDTVFFIFVCITVYVTNDSGSRV